MMLLTERYRDLQRDLHARYDYGHGGDAAECLELMFRMAPAGASVLDYGCGRGRFGEIARPRWDVRDYDPAISGKDGEPAEADFVVCADVLEHIEPECLDDVLRHITGLARLKAIFIIATGPSRKVMADGRTAHLIVEGADWWRERLARFFDVEGIEDRSDRGKGVLAICAPLRAVGPIRCAAAVSDEVRNQQVRENCARVSARLVDRRDAAGAYVPHDRTAILVCYGPSLQKTWPLVSMARYREDCDIVTVSAAHAFLLERDVRPFAHIDCDPREHKALQVGGPQAGVKYWLASCVHPTWLDRLSGHDIALWHSYNGKESAIAFDLEPGARMIAGGGSVGLRAISLLYCQGYRRFEIHGMDCSVGDDGRYHAGGHLGKPQEHVRVKCGDRWFLTTATLLLYLRYFNKQVSLLPDAAFHFHGDGLLQYSQISLQEA